MKPRRIIALALFLALFAGVGFDAQAQIRVGALLPLSGPLAAYGSEAHKALILAVADFGKGTLQLHVVDTEGRPERAVEGAGVLVTRDKVHLLLGPLLTAEARAVMSRLDDARVPMITPVRGTLAGKGESWVFRTEPLFEDLHRAGMMRWIAQLKSRNEASRFAVIFDKSNELSFNEGALVIPSLLKSLGAQSVAQASFYGRTSQFAPHLREVSAAAQQGFVIHASPVDGFNILRDLRELGFRGSTYLVQPPHPQFSAGELGAATSGEAYFAASFWLDPDDPQAASFTKRMERPAGAIAPFAGQLYDAVQAIALLAKDLPQQEPGAAVRRGLESSRNLKGLSGSFAFDEKRTMRREIRLIVVREGRFQLVRN